MRSVVKLHLLLHLTAISAATSPATPTAKFTATSMVRGRVLRCDVVMLRSAEGCGVL